MHTRTAYRWAQPAKVIKQQVQCLRRVLSCLSLTGRHETDNQVKRHDQLLPINSNGVLPLWQTMEQNLKEPLTDACRWISWPCSTSSACSDQHASSVMMMARQTRVVRDLLKVVALTVWTIYCKRGILSVLRLTTVYGCAVTEGSLSWEAYWSLWISFCIKHMTFLGAC